MITSPDNTKLKLVRKLRERRGREREGLFATEGEDLLAAGLASGAEPRFVLLAAGDRAAIEGSSLGGGHALAMAEEVPPELLAAASSLGSGTRAIAVWEQPAASTGDEITAPCVYLYGVGDPGNVGAILRTVDALLDGTVVLGPDCADPYGPKAIRASMGSIFSSPPRRAEVAVTPAPRVALVAHGGADGLEALAGAATVCLGAEREGLPGAVLEACEASATIPLRPGGAESLNVAAAAAIACSRMSEDAAAEEGDHVGA